MRTPYYIYSVAVAVVMLFMACSDGNDFGDDYKASLTRESVSAYVRTSESTISFGASASTQQVMVSANVNYSVSISEHISNTRSETTSGSWLTVTASDDKKTLTIAANSNTNTYDRSATVTLSGWGVSQKIEVTQSATTYITVNKESLSFEAVSSTQYVYVEANTTVTVRSSNSWVSTTLSENNVLAVTVGENTSTSERSATVTLSGGGVSKTIIITQAGASSSSETGSDRIFTITGNGKTVTFTMKIVKAGSFVMGDYNDGNYDTNYHNVTLTKDYYMGETEVTQALWYAVMGQSPTSDGSSWSSGYGQGDSYPAYYISYTDCEQFFTALNSKLSSQLKSGEQFRFPTEAEWEYAAKGGASSKGYTYAGSNTIDDVAWYTVNSYDKGSSSPDYGTHVVKTKQVNELGLYDMSGNVWEWCNDWYGSYSSDAQTDPTGATTGSYRVLRGGSWFNTATSCRAANRINATPGRRFSYLGVRLALQ